MSAIDWDGMLADLRAKRAAYDDAIQAIEHARGLLSADGGPIVIPASAVPVVPALPPGRIERIDASKMHRPPAPPPAPAASSKAAGPKPCARAGCENMVKPRKTPGRPKRFCGNDCAKRAYRESEERIGATAAINRR